MGVHEWEPHEISNNTGRREIVATTIVGSSGNHKGKTQMWKIYPLKEKAGNLNTTKRQDQRSNTSRITGGDTPGMNDHLLASRDHTRGSELISTLMLNLALHLYTIRIRHIQNCCVFMLCVHTRFAQGLFAKVYAWRKVSPWEELQNWKRRVTAQVLWVEI